MYFLQRDNDDASYREQPYILLNLPTEVVHWIKSTTRAGTVKHTAPDILLNLQHQFLKQ